MLHLMKWLRLGNTSSRPSRHRDRPRRPRFRPILECLECRLTPATDVWTGASQLGHNWSDAGNWSLGRIPTATDFVDFNSGFTVSNVDTAFTIAGLTGVRTFSTALNVNAPLNITGNLVIDFQGGGQFGGDGGLTIGGSASSWSHGVLVVGTGGFTNNGTFTINTGASGLFMNGNGTLTNNGTTHETGSSALNLSRFNTETLNNNGLYDFAGDCIVNGSDLGSTGMTNSATGTITKTAGTGTSALTPGVLQNLGGTLKVSSGTLALGSSFGSTVVNGATLEADAGATLRLTSGNRVTYQGKVLGSGAGTIQLDGGTIVVPVGGVSFAMPVSTLFQWNNGGTIDVSSGGTFTNTKGSIINMNTTGVSTNLTGSGTLINQGTMNETGNTSFFLSNGATLNNQATYNLKGDVGITSVGGGAIINTGTLKKSVGTGTSAISPTTLNNPGTILVQTGTMSIAASVSQVSGFTLTAGSWQVTGSATVHSTLTITSAGTIRVLGSAKVALTGAHAVFTNLAGLEAINSGARFTLGNGQSFTTVTDFSNLGTVALTGATLTITGKVVQLPAITPHTLTGGTWIVNANANLIFPAGASITALGGAKVTLNGANSNFAALANLATIGNTSSFILSGGRSFTTVGGFTNNGILTLGPNSTLTVNGGFTQTSTATLTTQIGGTAMNPTFGKIVTSATSTVALDGHLKVTSTVIPAVGTAFELLNDQAAGAISGVFVGLAEGATFTVKVGTTTMTFKISYVGSTGNDVVITRVS